MQKFLGGALLGVGLALLIAPMRGQEIRNRLRERLQFFPTPPLQFPVLQQTGERVAQTSLSEEGASLPGETLTTIPGIEPAILRMLEAQGIVTRQQLLEQTTTKEQRAELAQKVGMGVHSLKTLSTRVDLMQLSGVDVDTAILLEEAGVNGCKDLQQRNPEHLYTTLTEMHDQRKLAGPVLDREHITEWIAEAMQVTGTGVH